MDSRNATTSARLTRVLRLALITCLLLTSVIFAQQPPPDRRFGAVESFRDPSAATEAGVAWDRILFYWSELQPNGPEEWNGHHVPDEWLNPAIAAGREVIGVLKHSPAWATDGLPGCGVPRGLDLPVDDSGNLWAAFVRRTVQMYAGRINRWVIWNEPDIVPGTYGVEWCGSVEEYYQLLKVAYLAANQANPDVKIHLAGTTTWHDKDYLRKLLTVATQDPTGAEHGFYFDVATVHIYFQTETVPTIINETRATMTRFGLEKPIWVNETNASPDLDPLWPLDRLCWRVDLEEQAAFLLQSFALSLVNGAQRVAVYKWLDNDLPPGGEPFGVLRPDHSRRPAFDAYKLITTHYAGTVSGREERQSLYTVVTLNRGELTTRALWTRTQSPATVSVTALAAQARLIDQTGQEQVIQPVDGQYTIELPGARCPAERADCPNKHPACIVGGFTYLLIEDAQAGPPPDETAAPSPTEPPVDLTDSPAITATTAPTPLPTDTPEPTSTPTPSPTDTPEPTSTPTPLPTDMPTPTPPPHTPTPTLTPIPSPTPPPPPTATPIPPTPTTLSAPPLLIGMVAFVFLAVAVGVLFKRN